MPVSVFKDSTVNTHITMSEISGIQINRILVLATRMNSDLSQALTQVQELVESEFSRLMRQSVFTFDTPPKSETSP
jgi:LysR family nitrogen assimilation transcriptional regulator